MGQWNFVKALAELQEITLFLLFNACQKGKGDCYLFQTFNSKMAGLIKHSAFWDLKMILCESHLDNSFHYFFKVPHVALTLAPSVHVFVWDWTGHFYQIKMDSRYFWFPVLLNLKLYKRTLLVRTACSDLFLVREINWIWSPSSNTDHV